MEEEEPLGNASELPLQLELEVDQQRPLPVEADHLANLVEEKEVLHPLLELLEEPAEWQR